VARWCIQTRVQTSVGRYRGWAWLPLLPEFRYNKASFLLAKMLAMVLAMEVAMVLAMEVAMLLAMQVVMPACSSVLYNLCWARLPLVPGGCPNILPVLLQSLNRRARFPQTGATFPSLPSTCRRHTWRDGTALRRVED
jgi:hypothetical protein